MWHAQNLNIVWCSLSVGLEVPCRRHHGCSDNLECRGRPWLGIPAFNVENHAPESRNCKWLQTFRTDGNQCGMALCNTEAPHMCLYWIHCHVVWGPSIWCHGRCHFWQQHIYNDVHVHICGVMYAISLHIMDVYTKRHTNTWMADDANIANNG